jgi:ubiquinone/menaquinone biosynthesis C-methylase UbiE
MTEDYKLHKKIVERYKEESSQACDLSCGSTLQELHIKPGDVILDLGCGRGEETIKAAGLAGPDGKAVGLDLTEAMVIQAITNAVKEKRENTSFVQGDIESLPFEDGIFDGVTSNCVINHAKDKNRVYREIHRVLKPEGRFVVADAVTKCPLPAEVKNDPGAWAQCFGGAVTEEEYLESILTAGFRRVEILNRREYEKNGYDFISLTIKAVK